MAVLGWLILQCSYLIGKFTNRPFKLFERFEQRDDCFLTFQVGLVNLFSCWLHVLYHGPLFQIHAIVASQSRRIRLNSYKLRQDKTIILSPLVTQVQKTLAY